MKVIKKQPIMVIVRKPKRKRAEIVVLVNLFGDTYIAGVHNGI